jgi:hypothetical protein
MIRLRNIYRCHLSAWAVQRRCLNGAAVEHQHTFQVVGLMAKSRNVREERQTSGKLMMAMRDAKKSKDTLL